MKISNLFFLFFTITSLMFCSSPELQDEKKRGISNIDSLNNIINNDKVFIEKHPNGKIKIQGQLIDNKKQGDWIAFYLNGNKQSENFYKDDVLNGNTTAYYQNGKIRYVGFYLNGMMHGKWIYKDKNMFEEKIIWYNNGEAEDH